MEGWGGRGFVIGLCGGGGGGGDGGEMVREGWENLSQLQ